MSVLFELPLDSSRAARTLLLDVLQQGSAAFPSQTHLARELQNLFGASCQVYSERSAESHRMGFQINCLGQQFLPPGGSILRPALDLLGGILFDPLRGEDEQLFNQGYLSLERTNLLDMLAERKDNRSAYASERFRSLMCADEEYGKLSWGSSDEIAALSEQQLEDARLEIISDAEVTIVCSGACDLQEIERWAEEVFSGKSKSVSLPAPEVKYPQQLRHEREYLDIEQARLHVGMRVEPCSELMSREQLIMASSVLGGGSHGRLFQIIREQKSLAYGIYSRLHGTKHILSVDAGIDAQAAPEVENEVFKQIELLANDGPTENEIELARANRLNQLAAMADSPAAMADYYLASYASGINATPQQRADACMKVNAQQIIECVQKWQPDLVYMLSGK